MQKIAIVFQQIFGIMLLAFHRMKTKYLIVNPQGIYYLRL